MNAFSTGRLSLFLGFTWFSILGQPICAEPVMLRITSTDSLIDLTHNPGCGVKGLSREERIERNIRIAKFYFQSYANAQRENLKYTLGTYDCYSKDATFLLGTVDAPPAAPTPVRPFNPTENRSAAPAESAGQVELRAWQSVFPDIGAVPGTLRIIPWENGVNFSNMNSGTTKDGERVNHWEVVTMLISDDGRIIHHESWSDTMAIDRAFHLMFGRGVQGLTLKSYFEEFYRKGTAPPRTAPPR